jgi:hypothetical protein
MTVRDDTALNAAYERQMDTLFDTLVSNLLLAEEKPDVMSQEAAVVMFKSGLLRLRDARNLASGAMSE